MSCGIDFYAKGVRFRLTFGFLAVWAMILLQSAFSDTAMAALAACLLHELGHMGAMGLSGVKIRGLTFYSGGIRLKSESLALRRTGTEIFILAAGPFVNLLLAVISGALGFGIFAGVNISLMLFNLLPLSMLDGGRIMAALLEHICPLKDIASAQRITDILFGGGMTVFFILSRSAGFTLPLTMALMIAEGLWDTV